MSMSLAYRQAAIAIAVAAMLEAAVVVALAATPVAIAVVAVQGWAVAMRGAAEAGEGRSLWASVAPPIQTRPHHHVCHQA